jgi:D-amino-acid dehydrogenase
MEPDMKPDVVGGVYFPEDGHVNPEKLMSFLLEALETGGTQVCFGSKVQEIDPQKSSLLVSGEERVRKFDKFVLAAGSWSPSIASRLGLTIPMQAGKGYSMDVMNPPAMLRRPLVLGERKVAITPFRNSIRFGGTMEISGIHQKVNRTRVRAIQEAAEAYLPVVNQSWFSKVKIEQGLRPVSPDGLPYIGVHPLFPSIIIATGHSMMGVSLGPITGQLVAELADEKPLSLPIEKMKPDRF